MSFYLYAAFNRSYCVFAVIIFLQLKITDEKESDPWDRIIYSTFGVWVSFYLLLYQIFSTALVSMFGINDITEIYFCDANLVSDRQQSMYELVGEGACHV